MADEPTASAQRLDPGEVLQLDRRHDESPTNCEPECDRDEEDGGREQRDDEDRDHERTEERPDAVEREPVGAKRPDLPTLIDLDQCPRGRRLDESDAELAPSVVRHAFGPRLGREMLSLLNAIGGLEPGEQVLARLVLELARQRPRAAEESDTVA